MKEIFFMLNFYLKKRIKPFLFLATFVKANSWDPAWDCISVGPDLFDKLAVFLKEVLEKVNFENE